MRCHRQSPAEWARLPASDVCIQSYRSVISEGSRVRLQGVIAIKTSSNIGESPNKLARGSFLSLCEERLPYLAGAISPSGIMSGSPLGIRPEVNLVKHSEFSLSAKRCITTSLNSHSQRHVIQVIPSHSKKNPLYL